MNNNDSEGSHPDNFLPAGGAVKDMTVDDTAAAGVSSQNAVTANGGSQRPEWDDDKTEVLNDNASSGPAEAWLELMDGSRYKITTFPYVIGRETGCDLVLQGRGISRRHVEIVFQTGRFVVNDLDSLNGLKVNGYKVPRVILDNNDELQIGDVHLSFRSGVAAAAVAPSAVMANSSSQYNDAPFGSDDNIFATETNSRAPLMMAAAFSLVLLLGAVLYGVYQVMVPSSPDLVEIEGLAPPATASTSAAPSVFAPEPQSGAPASTSASRAPLTNSVPGIPVPPPPTFSAPPPPVAAQGLDATPSVTTPSANEAPPVPLKLNDAQSIASRDTLESGELRVSRIEDDGEGVSLSPPPLSPPTASSDALLVATSKEQMLRAEDLSKQAKQLLNNADAMYLRGQAGKLFSEAKALSEDPNLSEDDAEKLNRKVAKLKAPYNHYIRGKSDFDKGNKTRAFERWDKFLAAETKMFKGRSSAYSQRVIKEVSREYVIRANKSARNGQHHEAYRLWTAAFKLNENSAARKALDKVGVKVQDLYLQGIRHENTDIAKARDYWQQITELVPPGTEFHTKAMSKIAWYERWGG